MAFTNSIDLVASGMTAQKLRLDVVSENITNRTTTRTENGGAYRRKMVVFEQEGVMTPFQAALARARGEDVTSQIGGVRVAEIVEDESDFKLVYDPTHPDANEDGNVEMPNVDLIKEMSDAMAVSQAYSANVTSFNVLKQVMAKGLEIGK